MNLDPSPWRKFLDPRMDHIWSPFVNELMINFLICIYTLSHHDKDRIQTFHTVAILSEFNFKIFEPWKNALSNTCTFIFFKEIMLTIDPLTLWSQNVQIENFWSEMNFPKRIIYSFQTSWNKLAKLSIRKLTLTSQTLYIQFHDVGTYELLPISQKPLKLSNWNFTSMLQGYIGVRKYTYLNFDQVPHLDPKSHGWSHIILMKVHFRENNNCML